MPRSVRFALLTATAFGLLPVSCAAPAEDWTHTAGARYTVEHPVGWTVAAGAREGSVDIRGTAGQRVLVWPVFFPAKLDAKAAPGVLERLAAMAGASARWERSEQIGTSAVRALGRNSGRAVTAALTWTTDSRGTAACLYVAAGPEHAHAQAGETVARVLASFQARGEPAERTGTPPLEWIRWPDPKENAFTVEVPKDWRVEGGLYRFAPVDVRVALTAVSPDGLVRVAMGDAGLPVFTEPSPMLAMAGFREGAWYSPGYGVNMLVRRYTPGLDLAREYVLASPATGCPAEITGERDRADFVEALNRLRSQFEIYGVIQRLTAGEVRFRCTGGEPSVGYWLAGTQATRTQGMEAGMWNVEYLFGFRAVEQREAEARSVLAHVVESFRLSPQWLAVQQGLTASTSQIVARTNAFISKTISEGYNHRQFMMDELDRRRSNANLGVEDVVDPVTGQHYRVESGADYYWIDHRGTIVGTGVHVTPDIDFRELTRLP